MKKLVKILIVVGVVSIPLALAGPATGNGHDGGFTQPIDQLIKTAF